MIYNVTKNYYTGIIDILGKDQIFVFGSNTEGRHGAGAALYAKKHFGAIYGQAEGLQGRSYAIITKDLTKTKHPSIEPKHLKWNILKFYHFAEDNEHLLFFVAYDGESKLLNGYNIKEFANMWNINNQQLPINVVFEEKFKNLIYNI
jgi:hypothetical protein